MTEKGSRRALTLLCVICVTSHQFFQQLQGTCPAISHGTPNHVQKACYFIVRHIKEIRQQDNIAFVYRQGCISCIQPTTGKKPIDLQCNIQHQPTPDALLTGEQIATPRGSFRVTNMTHEQMEAAGYGYHHSSDDGKYLIMGNGTQAFAIAAPQREQENYLKNAEMSIEQNYNMIDGQINNTPSVDELEEKAKRGEVISLSALAAAVKAEDGRTPQRDPDGKKPSIRAQLKADRAQSAAKPKQKEKEQEAKRSIRQALERE